jgi:tol-pal system protein YbgF
MTTAMTIMAVVVLAISFNACVTPRHIDEVKSQIRDVEAQNRELRTMVTRMDSLTVQGADADNRLRNEIAFSMDEMQQQMSVLLENYNDLMQKLEQLGQDKNVVHVLKSSEGAQTPANPPSETAPAQVTGEPAIDCDFTYDEAFILVRRGEYEAAIEGFGKFLEACPKHESVENAYYWIGESYYAIEKYPDAVVQFEKLINDYKTSPNIGRALYKLARSKQELGKKAEAKTIFQRLIDEFPETLEAQQARERLKDLK